MFNKLKKQSLAIMKFNYLPLILLTVFLSASKCIINLSANYIAGRLYIYSLQSKEALLNFILLLIFGFIINPLFQVALFKACILSQESEDKIIFKSLKFVFNISNMKKIFAINIIPGTSEFFV